MLASAVACAGTAVQTQNKPTATEPHAEFQTNYSEAQESSFRLGATAKGKERKFIVIAGSLEGPMMTC